LDERIDVRGVGNYSTFFAKAPIMGPKYNTSLDALRIVIDPKRLPAAVYDYVANHLRSSFPHYTWVGVYLLEGETLKLAAWRGPAATDHTAIPIGQGICGLAARTRETVVVPDVSKDPRYLACFPNTKSEIVIPIQSDGTVYGEIDIDSDTLDAFSTHDRQFLGVVADDLARYLKARAA
jgi:GAF domain-containing protein